SGAASARAAKCRDPNIASSALSWVVPSRLRDRPAGGGLHCSGTECRASASAAMSPSPQGERVCTAGAAAINSQETLSREKAMGGKFSSVACWLCMTVALAANAAAEPVKLRIGWTTMPGHLAPILDVLAERHPEIFPHAGKSYVAQAVRFNGGTPQIQ